MSSKKQGLNNTNVANTKIVDDRLNSEAVIREESTTSLKHQPEIDGPQQASQETDDVYVDTRQVDENLPPAGKNVGDLNVNDLSKKEDK